MFRLGLIFEECFAVLGAFFLGHTVPEHFLEAAHGGEDGVDHGTPGLQHEHLVHEDGVLCGQVDVFIIILQRPLNVGALVTQLGVACREQAVDAVSVQEDADQ